MGMHTKRKVWHVVMIIALTLIALMYFYPVFLMFMN